MLLGADIHVFTDHKNLTFDTLKMHHMLRWNTKAEEFSPMLHYIEAPCNILANNLSRLHCLVTPAQIAAYSLQRFLMRKKTKRIS